MLQIKKILVPTDFSECSKSAIPVANDLAKVFGAQIMLMHVVAPSTYPVANVMRMRHLPNIQEEVHKRCREELDALLKAFDPALESEARLAEGMPASELVNATKQEAIDLIVVSTHGHTGIKYALLGSTAEKIVRLAPCPVLTVKSTAGGD